MRDLIRKIAMEDELQIIPGNLARDHVQVWVSCRPKQDVNTIVQRLTGISSRVLLQEFPHLGKQFWGDTVRRGGSRRGVRGKWSSGRSRNKRASRWRTTVSFQLTTVEATGFETAIVDFTDGSPIKLVRRRSGADRPVGQDGRFPGRRSVSWAAMWPGAVEHWNVPPQLHASGSSKPPLRL